MPRDDAESTLALAVEAAKDVEAELARLRAAVEEYLLWEPGRAGHAAAHRRLREALNGDDRG